MKPTHIDNTSWHAQEEFKRPEDGGDVNNARFLEFNDEYAATDIDRLKENLDSINQAGISDLQKRMFDLSQADDIDDETFFYLSAFQKALGVLSNVKGGRSLNKMIDSLASNEDQLDAIISIGDYSEDRFPFTSVDQQLKAAVTFLRRTVGHHARHEHEHKFEIVERVREHRWQKAVEKAEEQDVTEAQKIRDSL